MNVKTCPDCNAPIRDNMYPVSECWYWGQTEEWQRRNGFSEEQIRDWRQSGGDPPCEGNAYDKRFQDQNRRFWLYVVAIATIAALGYAAIIIATNL